MTIALGILTLAEHLIDLVNKIKANREANGGRELTEEERAQLDARIASLKDRAHWKPSTLAGS